MSYNPQNPNGQATGANSSPVVIASDQSAVSVNEAQVGGTATSTNNGVTDAGTQRVTLSSDSTGQVIARGNVASGSADSGNPVKVGGRFNSTPPTFTDGQRGDLQLDASGNLKVITSNTLSSVSINDGTTTANNLAGDTGQNAVLTAGSRKEAAFSFAGAGAGTAVDVSNYRWVSIQITSNTGTLQFEGSNDNSTYVAVALMNAQTTAGAANTTSNSSSAIFHGPLPYRYFRLRSNSGASGGTMEFFANPAAMQTMGITGGTVSATQSGTWTVQPGNTANTTSWNMNLAPSTTGGWSVSSQTNLTTTATVVGAASKFAGYMFINLNSAPAYIQVFNLATSGAVTLGTTTPTFVVPIPANSTAANGAGANLELANGIAMSLGIQVAATTTPTGATTVTTGLTGFVLYK